MRVVKDGDTNIGSLEEFFNVLVAVAAFQLTDFLDKTHDHASYIMYFTYRILRQ